MIIIIFSKRTLFSNLFKNNMEKVNYYIILNILFSLVYYYFFRKSFLMDKCKKYKKKWNNKFVKETKI